MGSISLFRKIIESFLPYLVVFLASLYRPIDPDLGWHLKYGEYFFLNGKLLYENTFSTEMPGFAWPNISYGIDLITYLLYNWGGFLFLTLGGAIIITLTFLFFAKAYKLTFWEKAFIFPLLLYLLRPINSDSFRGQHVSLALLGLLIYILSLHKLRGTKVLYFVPFLFLFWVNTHGLFLMGLGILVIWQTLTLGKLYILKNIEEFKITLRHFSLITILSFLFTLINPFGINVYIQTLHHFNNPLLKSIVEYLPAEELSQQWYLLFVVAMLAGIGISSFFFSKTIKEKLTEVGIFGILFTLSLWVKRYAWAMYYSLIPLIKPLPNFIKPDTKKGEFIGAAGIFGSLLLLIVYVKSPFTQYNEMDWRKYCELSTDCSPEAANALRSYYKEGETMTLYNWGGWLIWNYPDIKPSTDGRMHLWRDEKGYSAFEYDYNIEQNLSDIQGSKYSVVFTSKDKPIYGRLTELREGNRWELVYEDNTSVVFVRLN